MKFRASEVTNSSSTSFLMAFKGDIYNLYELLVKYKEHFKLHYELFNEEVYDIHVWDVIRALDQVVKSNSEQLWIRPEIRKIDEGIQELKSDLDSWKNDVSFREDGWVKRIVTGIQEKIALLESAKEKGLTSFLKIGFGDNDGEISGGRVGTTMDYEGRKIRIDEPDFVIVTEQNR